jgi:undecaprenyl-diphosphatase
VTASLMGNAQARRFAANVAIAFIPAALLALLFGKYIKAHLFSPVMVAAAFIAGGVVIFWAERRENTVRVLEVEAMTWKDALKVGLAQCFALIPGTSRSGATIIGGLLFGLSRKAATEFSFFLAIPTLDAATVHDLIKHRAVLYFQMTGLLAVGFTMSFISALIAVRGLLRYISHHDFMALSPVTGFNPI